MLSFVHTFIIGRRWLLILLVSLLLPFAHYAIITPLLRHYYYWYWLSWYWYAFRWGWYHCQLDTGHYWLIRHCRLAADVKAGCHITPLTLMADYHTIDTASQPLIGWPLPLHIGLMPLLLLLLIHFHYWYNRYCTQYNSHSHHYLYQYFTTIVIDNNNE